MRGPSSRAIPRRSDGGPAPLSFAERRLWFLDRFEPGNPAYNVGIALRFDGRLHAAALERSLAEIVRRHETLRTSFAEADGEAFQRIAPSVALELPSIDLRGLAPEQREEQARRLAAEEARRPFDLREGALLRSTLLRLDEDAHILLIVMHHVICDGWSVGVLARELCALYEAFRKGRPSPLPELPIQYADFAVWQRGWLQGEVLDRLLSYWKARLAGPLPVLELPADRPRPPVQTYRGARESLPIPRALFESLRALALREGATLFMTLLAAFQVLLHRYTGEEDVLVGSPIANRNRTEVEGLIGFFVNTLVLRTDLSGDPSFRELLSRVRGVAEGAYSHQDLPFELLVEELHPEREMSRLPLFQVSFSLQNVPMPAAELPGLSLSLLRIDNRTSKFDLFFALVETDEGLLATAEYNTDLFDAATVSRMLRNYRTLLEGIAAWPERHISALPLLTEAERRQLLVEWNDTRADFPAACIHQLIETRAAESPDAIAVVFGEQRLTYGELNARANRLAHHLRRLGVGPEVFVGICLERSSELILGLLAVLKAGGAYVPLDATYPKERLAFMLEDTRVSVVLTQEHLRESLPCQSIPVICLDSEDERFAGESRENLAVSVTDENLAYVLYTSGSTGNPKGVSVPHRAVVRLVRGSDFARLTSEEVFLQFSPLAFDVSTLEIWGCLANGARLVVFPGAAPSLAELGDALRKYEITTLWLTAGLFQQMVESQLPSLKGLRQLLSGGDVLPVEQVRKALRELPGCRLINGYGPTEATTFTSCYAVVDAEQIQNSVPIGRPIARTQVYVLDRRGHPVPIGVPGELHIGGEGLARGYADRPDLTAERFIPNPFGTEPGTRLYRSGDLARYRPDGNLEFLGRVDLQVKIRGFRVEPGEIEEALRRHHAVREAAVIAREDLRGGKRLLAYLVIREAPAPPITEWRRFLKRRLPDYMMPSAFVILPALPMTGSGKVDRRALPPPEQTRPELESAFAQPGTSTERLVAGIWAEVLGLEEVGIHDNFFELGGHSLLATQVVSRIREAFHVELPLRTLFDNPTVAALAARLGSQQSSGSVVVSRIPRGRREGDSPLSFSQERVWFLQKLHPENKAYSFQALLDWKGKLDVAALTNALSEIVRRHEILRSTFPAVEGQAVQRVHDPYPVTLPCIDLASLPAAGRIEEAKRRIQQEIEQGFDLERLPLVRWTLLRLGEEEHQLVHVEHHLLHDGWSFNVFLAELWAVYEAFSRERPSPLSEPPIQFAHFAHWQREWLRGDEAKKQAAYWRKTLDGLPPLLELPSERPRPAVQSFRGSALRFELPAARVSSWRDFGRRERVTLFHLLFSAFLALLHRYTQQEDICVGSGIANRRSIETEGLLGMIINNLVLRADLSGDPTVRELLGRIREVTQGAYAHQDLPFDKLVEELHPERSLSRNPLFQVMFSFHDAPFPVLTLPELAVTVTEALNNGSAKFDLSVIVIPRTAGPGIGRRNGDDGLRVIWEYSTDLFDEPAMTRMIGHYQNLVDALVADPSLRLSQLPLLTPSERRQVLVDWNDTRMEEAEERTIHRLFEAQAGKSPDAIAVDFGAERLTYRELDARANRLARGLRRRGVRPEVLVGVCMERSLEMVVGLLGILKAGGAYVPLDPAHPKERLAFMLEDAKAPVVLSQERLAEALSPFAGEVLFLDGGSQPIGGESEEALDSGVTSENLAYLIYTSGSTGKPKGVMISHGAIRNHMLWMQRTFPLTAADRVLQKTSASFDAAVWEFYAPLLAGARLVVAGAEAHRDSRELAETVHREQITVLQVVPALLQMLLEEPGLSRCRSLRRVFCGGGPLTAELQQSFFARLPAELINLYGPTEATIDATFWTCRRESAGGIVPIGRPISNAVAYVLDRYGNPVPIGVSGELCLGGAGLARGYWNRPELTAEKFIPNIFSGQPASRLYRTGDLARYLPDGSLEYLGRLDHQVKIRGFRVELGEIESILASLPSVRECAVVARQSDSGETSLVAYLAAEEARTSMTRELRRALSQKLPEPLIPSVFVTLDRLPRTPAGKVDRQALPQPGGERLERPARYAAPRTPLEEALAGIWAALLGRDRVGIDDNFFALGGHSLMAMRVLSHVRQAYGVDLPLRTLFETPTVAALGLAVLHRLAVNKDGREISGLLAALKRVSEKEALRLLADESRSGERLGFEEDPNLESKPVVAEGERGAR